MSLYRLFLYSYVFLPVGIKHMLLPYVVPHLHIADVQVLPDVGGHHVSQLQRLQVWSNRVGRPCWHLVEVVLLLEVGKISITSRHVLESSFIIGQIIRFYKKFLANLVDPVEVDPEGLEQLHAAAGVRSLNYWIHTSTELSKKKMQWQSGSCIDAPVCASLTAGGRGAGRVARHLGGVLRGSRNRGICLDYD